MENNISIQKLSNEYVKDVFEIEQDQIDVPWSLKLISELVDGDNTIAKVLLLNEKVIGYYSFYVVCDEANINNLAISKENHSQGYSKILMEDLINECKIRDIKDITLEVSSNNIVAINLYKKYGFKIEGTRKGYYKNNEDAYIMWRR